MIFTGASSLLSVTGLIDAKITSDVPGSETDLTVGISTKNIGSDLVNMFGLMMANKSNFIVTDKLTGLVVPITLGALNGTNRVDLTGTFVSGKVYNVIGSTPSIWSTNGVKGFDGSSNGVDITITL
jgi:hypothetical protein